MGINQQTFHLFPKMREVDCLLRSRRRLKRIVYEAHPELAFARWSRVPAAREAELLRIAVAPEARGRGLGRALLEACQRELAEEGLAQLFLEVRPTNLAAIRLYERCGWEPCGRRPRYYSDGEDALLFQRVG